MSKNRANFSIIGDIAKEVKKHREVEVENTGSEELERSNSVEVE